MGKVTFTKRSFASGELSPRIYQSRSDLQIYSQGLAHCLNLIPLRAGALINRPNTITYPDLRMPSGARRLIPFYLTDDTHVLLVFGSRVLSFVEIEGGKYPKVIKEVDTPYSSDVVEQLSYAFSGNLIVLAHKNHPPHKIEKTDNGFNFSLMKFSPPPWLGSRIVGGSLVDAKITVEIPEDKGEDEASMYNVKAVGSDVFQSSDKGRPLRIGFHPKAWKKKTKYSENSFIHMYGKVYQSTQKGISGSEWVDNNRDSHIVDGGVIWKVVSSTLSLGSDSKEKPTGTLGPTYPYYVWGSIIHVEDNRNVVIRLNTPFTLHDDNPTPLWNLSAWDSKEGYPGSVTFYQNRLVFSGTESDASSLYLSEYRNYNNFSPDGEYGSPDYLKALSVTVTDDVLREIRWVTPMGSGLLIGCDSSLWLLRIDMENGFNIVTLRISGSGVYSCPALSVGDFLLFVCGAGRRIKAVSGDTEQGFKFTDVTQFTDHLFTFRIKQMVYQEDPYSLIWVIDRSIPKADESYNLLGCRFTSEDEIDFAWHAHRVGGEVALLSLATFPSIDRGETDLWILTMRRVKDRYETVLEKLERFHASHNHLADGVDE